MAGLLAWVRWWNTEHRPEGLDGRTPFEAWAGDPTPLSDAGARQLAFFALEDDGRVRTITTHGVRWHRRDYLAGWMVGRTGTKVVVRHLPHHDDSVEVFDVADGDYLGSACLAEAASEAQVRALKAARTASARRLRADLKAAERLRRDRFQAQTVAGPAVRRRTPTRAEAGAELEGTARRDRRALARPDLIPHSPVPDHWVLPVPLPAHEQEGDGHRGES